VAVGQLDVDPERALLLALEAITAAVSFESRDALQQAVSASRLRQVFEKAGAARILHAYFAKDNRFFRGKVQTPDDSGVSSRLPRATLSVGMPPSDNGIANPEVRPGMPLWPPSPLTSISRPA
jgi:hypothetical protein